VEYSTLPTEALRAEAETYGLRRTLSRKALLSELGKIRAALSPGAAAAAAAPEQTNQAAAEEGALGGGARRAGLVVVEGTVPTATLAAAEIVIMSYDAVRTTRLPAFAAVVCDESHHLKSRTTARTRALLPMLTAARRVVMLSGTPAMSRPAELFPQVHALRPDLFPGWEAFVDRYCGGLNRFGGAHGSSNSEELQRILGAELMIRREKEAVLTTLPPKVRAVVRLPVSALSAEVLAELGAKLAELEQVEAQMHAARAGGGEESDRLRNAVQAKLSVCYQLSADAKAAAALAFLETRLAATPAGKLLFCPRPPGAVERP
jgi:SWI/SNF-related matrix-associated actin-dependent regulator 1 of chromatin subfamily A